MIPASLTEKVSSLLVEAAATEILPRFRALQAHDVQEKSGPNDLVTAADLASEAFLTPRLRELIPGSLVVGEEAVSADANVLNRLLRDDYVWIIDPVDGTYNFVHGDPGFGVIVALLKNGVTVGGWMHAPVEGGNMAAEKGAGAFENGVRLHVAKPGPIREMRSVLYVGAERSPALYQRIKQVKNEIGPRSHRRCAAMEYFGLARGQIHYAIFNKLLPWDHAAGAHIVEEAGGYLRCMDGDSYVPAGRESPLLVAPDAATWHTLHKFYTA
ncbi:MAG: inositol monophosphatase [Alphaproteobacteria bacterium]